MSPRVEARLARSVGPPEPWTGRALTLSSVETVPSTPLADAGPGLAGPSAAEPARPTRSTSRTCGPGCRRRSTTTWPGRSRGSRRSAPSWACWSTASATCSPAASGCGRRSATGAGAGAGGADGPEIVAAAAGLECFQAAALLHDDVMDGSDTRRGRPAMHRQRRPACTSDLGWAGDSDRFGEAAAILAGDLCLAWSDELLAAQRAAAPTRCRRARRLRHHADRADGRAVPRRARAGGRGRRRDVERALRVLRYKSAKYTVEHPLLLGAALAGAGPSCWPASRRTACRSARRSSCATTSSASSATRTSPASRPATTCARASAPC